MLSKDVGVGAVAVASPVPIRMTGLRRLSKDYDHAKHSGRLCPSRSWKLRGFRPAGPLPGAGRLPQRPRAGRGSDVADADLGRGADGPPWRLPARDGDEPPSRHDDEAPPDGASPDRHASSPDDDAPQGDDAPPSHVVEAPVPARHPSPCAQAGRVSRPAAPRRVPKIRRRPSPSQARADMASLSPEAAFRTRISEPSDRRQSRMKPSS